jgi:hypothetical protein
MCGIVQRSVGLGTKMGNWRFATPSFYSRFVLRYLEPKYSASRHFILQLDLIKTLKRFETYKLHRGELIHINLQIT